MQRILLKLYRFANQLFKNVNARKNQYEINVIPRV